MKDLLGKFAEDIEKIEETRSVSLFKGAGAKLQSVYDFYITSENSFIECEQELKNIFSSFNYAAVIINSALKSGGGLSEDDGELLEECLEIMLKCCRICCDRLTGK